MKRAVLACLLIGAIMGSVPAHAASHSMTYRGGNAILALTFFNAKNGFKMTGTFRTPSGSFAVEGDWLPSGDSGSDLLRFYGHPFPKNSLNGLMGLAVMQNTCLPNCAASTSVVVAELQNVPPLPVDLPGLRKSSITMKVTSH